MKTNAFAAFDSTSPLRSFQFERRSVEPQDVQIDIHYCGVCHSDLHTVNGDWGPQNYPLVPGHEIVGKVESIVKHDGTMVLLGVPAPQKVSAMSLLFKRKRLAGSLIGGIAETQELLDFCSQHKIGAEVEVIPIQQINEAYVRMVKGDVRYRFVIDMKSLK